MREREPLFGAFLIFVVCIVFAGIAERAIEKSPGVLGVFYAFGDSIAAFFICRSIYRDRVR